MEQTLDPAKADSWPTMPMPQRMALQYEVEQFLYAEAALLDGRKFRDWFALLAQDIHYWMPIRRTVTSDNLDMEFTQQGDMAYFDDDLTILDMRLKKQEAGSSWAEEPPSRSRHFVGNVRILKVAGDELTVEVAFYIYRSRLNSDVDTWVGRREDVLRRHGDSFQIAQRHIFLDQTVIQSANFSTFF